MEIGGEQGFNEYTAVPPPPAQVYSPPQRDLSWIGLPEFVDDTVSDYTRPTPSVYVSKDVRSDLDGVEAAGIDTIEATKKQQDVILINGGDDYISSLDYDSWIGEWNLL
ncbi:hypothetical protein Tco_0832647 [Tanacetum coccineum]